MAPKIHENRSKNGSGTDLGPLIIDLLAFWSDAKKHEFVMPFWRFKNPKIGPRCGQEAFWKPRRLAEYRIFENMGPWGGLARDLVLETRNKKLG